MGPVRRALKLMGGLMVLSLASLLILFTVLTKPAQRMLAARRRVWPPESGFLIFLHTYTVWKHGSKGKYLALEIDRIRLSRGSKVRVDWLVISDSGIRFFPSLVDGESREVILFNGRPMNGHYVVLWLPRGVQAPESLMIYDCEGRLKAWSRRTYYLRELKTANYRAVRSSSGGWAVERLSVEYDWPTGWEVYTLNQGYAPGAKYQEIYRLISDSFGI
jgi:hypothetical protein